MRRKENEKDVKKRYNMKIRFRYIMDSHHTNKTYQEEYKEQF